MKKITALILSLFSLGLFSASSALADPTPTLLTCNGCSLAQMESVSRNYFNKSQDEFIAVVDHHNEMGIKFHVSLQENAFGKTVSQLTVIELTAEESDNIEAMIEARKALAQFLPESVKLSPKTATLTKSLLDSTKTSFNFDYQYLYYGSFTQTANVYDFMQASFLRNNAYQAYFGGYGGTYFFSLLSKALISFKLPYGIYDGLGLHINIQFEDDNQQSLGIAQVAIDPAKETFNVIAATDADNNSIPVDKEQLSGQSFIFSSDENKIIFDQYIEQFSSATEKCQSVSKRDYHDISLYTYQCTTVSTD
ncbi:hypothetical protein [Shewanella surugensis]|uniref:Uncharacterized protein n=1 Tax=Shewanella surugensis TaxID=212020 RepID=A0ABT0L782_9GAMM|nr:hypothetical protein [Shewanella surugensis]MCL1123554.1 hypothetical protein [Shewanella surugensis]